MEKVKELTDEQRAKIPEYVKKWIDIGLSCTPTNRERARMLVKDYYEVAGLQAPGITLFGKSPKQSMQFTNIMLLDNYDSLVAKYPAESLEATFELIIANADSSTLRSINTWNSNFVGGNMWADWQAFNDYFKNVVGVEGLEIIEPTLRLSEEVGWIFPYNNFVVLTEKPVFIHRNAEGRLHKDGDMCIKWQDGWGFYRLNGISVSEYVALTPAAELDAKKILALPNVDERREAIRKLGASNMILQLGGKVLDTKVVTTASGLVSASQAELSELLASGNVISMAEYVKKLNKGMVDVQHNYELLAVDWTGSERKYLKMSNPSIEAVHIEAVHPACETVDMALGFRNQDIFGDAWQDKNFKFKAPIVLT